MNFVIITNWGIWNIIESACSGAFYYNLINQLKQSDNAYRSVIKASKASNKWFLTTSENSYQEKWRRKNLKHHESLMLCAIYHNVKLLLASQLLLLQAFMDIFNVFNVFFFFSTQSCHIFVVFNGFFSKICWLVAELFFNVLLISNKKNR